jgi:hypothetical protein
MKILLYILLFLFEINSLSAQDSTLVQQRVFPMNNIYIEIAGSGLAYGSINYERIIVHSKTFYLSGRTGIGYFGFLSVKKMISVPLIVSTIFQMSKVFAIEFGAGGTFAYLEQEGNDYYYNGEINYDQFVIPSALIGIRLQKINGFLFRTTFTPFFTYESIYPVFGMSFGYSFGK